MPPGRRQHAAGTDERASDIDSGTLCRAATAPPGPADLEASQAYMCAMIHVQSTLNGPLVATAVAQTLYQNRVIEVARRYLCVRESTPNRGDEVDAIVRGGGWSPGGAWCAAFSYFCHMTAATELGGRTTCPQPRHPRAVFMWYDAGTNYRYTAAQLLDGQAQTAPGDVLVMARPGTFGHLDRDSGEQLSGHSGLVISWDAANTQLLTIEGNTNSAGSSEGDGVYEKRRTVQRNPTGRAMAVYGCVRPQFIPGCP